MIIDDLMTDRITLHGLGFIQIQLEGRQRMHVWHPELPRRHCFESSSIHDHRFDFESLVLVGQQRNIEYHHSIDPHGDYFTYIHEGPRTANGGRPWVRDNQISVYVAQDFVVSAGNKYTQQAYRFHRTIPQGNGKVATILQKRGEGRMGAHSTCLTSVVPDSDFDRFQLPPSKLWEFVSDVLSSGEVS